MASNFENFSILWIKSAHKTYDKLPIKVQNTIHKHIDLLVTDYQNSDIKKLKGYENLYRLRVGDYRVIFSINQDAQQVIIAAIGHRKEIYNTLIH